MHRRAAIPILAEINDNRRERTTFQDDIPKELS